MSSPFSNKLITVTGAASGIGLSTARLLAARGALLSIADYNAEKLAETYASLIAITAPENVLSTALDIRSTADVNAWIAKTVEHFGRPLDGCANVAGFHPLWAPLPFHEISDEDFDEVMAINSTGLFKCLRAQLKPGVFPEAGGAIVNVGSVSGLIGFPFDAAYVASKHAAHGLTKAASKEAGKMRIRVNCVAPGQTNTPMVRDMEKGKGFLPVPPDSSNAKRFFIYNTTISNMKFLNDSLSIQTSSYGIVVWFGKVVVDKISRCV
ncbi:NAD(P)-binding protein [Corynespora cassiicola Philippines]|uniref:NAD(P)-binding protein n=1 Tax=Corynespora cassiicola Philippines TaxID=1448308 RepID=A0A2T2N2I8_CORCC|nr:NAD(P)-binding protein [Corynespora cassiicola Philippines]